MTGPLLITRATGTVGGAVLGRLSSADVRLRALTRDEGKARSLGERGIEAAVADYLEPEMLGPALRGVGVIFLLTPIGPDQVAQSGHVIEAARESGHHPRIVRLSVHQASCGAPTRVSRQHAEVGEALRASGLPYTQLRPQSFMQDTLAAAATVAGVAFSCWFSPMDAATR